MDDLFMTGKPVVQGIENHSLKMNLSVHPNPATDYVVISVNDVDDHSVEVMDLTGKTVFSAMVSGRGITIDLRSFPCGIYFVSCKSEGYVNVGKFVKR
jgi:hypothetical protein